MIISVLTNEKVSKELAAHASDQLQLFNADDLTRKLMSLYKSVVGVAG